MKKQIFFVLITLLAIGLLFYDTALAQGCVQCRMAPGSNLEEGGTVAKNINTGIMYLMVVPYMAIAFIFGYTFRKPLYAYWLKQRKKFKTGKILLKSGH